MDKLLVNNSYTMKFAILSAGRMIITGGGRNKKMPRKLNYLGHFTGAIDGFCSRWCSL